MAGDNQSFTQWQSASSPDQQVTNPVLGPAPAFRNSKDRLLTRWGSSPDTQHPDGYLGTMDSNRRQDRLLSAVKRQNHRSYSRGVHKGERVNPGDYIWPDEFNPESGVTMQATSVRIGRQMMHPKQSVSEFEEVRLTNDGKAGPRGVPRGLDRIEMEPIDPQRASALKNLLPRYK